MNYFVKLTIGLPFNFTDDNVHMGSTYNRAYNMLLNGVVNLLLSS